MIIRNDTMVFEKGDKIVLDSTGQQGIVTNTVELGGTPVELQQSSVSVRFDNGDMAEANAWDVLPLDIDEVKMED